MANESTLQPERRKDEVSARRIEDALALQQMHGKGAAIACLASQGIAEHVIMRVLACAAFRRKPAPQRSAHRRDISLDR